jgi:endonuclease III
VETELIKKLLEFGNGEECDNEILSIDSRKLSPLGYFISCICDRQISMEDAWAIGKRIDGDGYTLKDLLKFTPTDWQEKIIIKHRYINEIADCLCKSVAKIQNEYESDVKNIFETADTCETLFKRLCQFEGIGQKIGTMCINLAYKFQLFKFKFKDLKCLDISADTHICFVFWKSFGLGDGTTTDNNKKLVIQKARELSFQYINEGGWILDAPCFTIGKNYCHKKCQECNKCYINDVCLNASILK